MIQTGMWPRVAHTARTYDSRMLPMLGSSGEGASVVPMMLRDERVRLPERQGDAARRRVEDGFVG